MNKHQTPKRTRLQAALLTGAVSVAAATATLPVLASGANPQPVSRALQLAQSCNPCAAKKKGCNPCNPCAAKKKGCNPCNPCAAKKGCNPCNPCAAKKK
jgi:hypothetical protein